VGFLRDRAIGLRDDLEQMAVGIMEVQAAAAIKMVNLAGAGEVKIRVEFDARLLNPLERHVKLHVADEERVMPRSNFAALREIQRHAVARAHGQERAPFRSDLKSEDAREETRGLTQG
jgi:hypothetical protein